MDFSKKTTEELKQNYPDVKSTWGSANYRNKFRTLEDDWKRPFMAYDRCDIEHFGFELCMRHNTKVNAKDNTCKLEFEDFNECMNREKSMKYQQKLIEASNKAGDPIPSTSFKWNY